MNRTVSGCAIILLVDQVTGLATQSYASDAALLDELRVQWPPAGATDAPAGEERGYVRVGIDAMRPVAAVRLADRFAVALASGPDASADVFDVLPLVRDGRWRLARPGDGLSAFVSGVPFASERSVGVDQTHASVVVGERAIVKWFRHVGPGPSRAAVLLAHLAEVGFDAIPTPLGSVAWRSPDGAELTLAQGDEYLPGARDGWEWCVERVPQVASIGRVLGELVARLHRALASSSSVIADPLEVAGTSEIAGWRSAALATFDSAFGEADEAWLEAIAPSVRADIEAMPTDRPVPVQPVHGDLHVGQILEWSGGLAIIDFDGNPTLGPEANAIRQPRERDIAQMLSSLDHVGRVVDKRSGWTRTADVETWIAATRAEFLASVAPVEERVLAAFEAEHECRELLYATRFLPRWRYAPLATLRARY